MNVQTLGLNYVDVLIVFVFIFFFYEGFKYGFWISLSHLFSFLLSLFLALSFYKDISSILAEKEIVEIAVSKPISFLFLAIISEFIIGSILGKLIRKIPDKILYSKLFKYLGLLPSFGEGIIITSFVTSLILIMPIPANIKRGFEDSSLTKFSVGYLQKLESYQKEIFGEALEESLTYLTIDPKSTKRVYLQTHPLELKVDEMAEKQMYELINEERNKVGVEPLEYYLEVVPIARSHAEDMWKNRYFAHLSVDGKDAGDRLTDKGINYFAVGENLALAPSVKTAHIGLMNSQAHKQNILDPLFQKVAVGVIDNGIYGKIFVQIFIR